MKERNNSLKLFMGILFLLILITLFTPDPDLGLGIWFGGFAILAFIGYYFGSAGCGCNLYCQFAEGWKNKEGWLIFNDRLVCLDWDEYCTKCRVDDSEDYVFDVDLKEAKT